MYLFGMIDSPSSRAIPRVSICWPLIAGLAAGLAPLPAALAQADDGFDLVTIRAVGNAPYTNPDSLALLVNGRGRVDYEYRIGRTEITSGQWLEFLQTFQSVPSPSPFWENEPVFWGGYRDIDDTYHLRDVPDAAMLPCGGIPWRMAALYCNWLTNGKSADPTSLITGAYDSTTWGNGTRPFEITDAPVHLVGARYWIPTLDEQLKAFQYDPDRYGPGLGGWWDARNKSDAPGIAGPPGLGTTSAGWRTQDDPWAAWEIPLGAYPQSLSPWGLLDTSGGANEWNEQIYGPDYPSDRVLMGSYAGEDAPAWQLYDHVWGASTLRPYLGSSEGFRIATSVPSPGAIAGLACLAMCRHRKRRNRS